jgi:predicted PurR-regulated permease PerM
LNQNSKSSVVLAFVLGVLVYVAYTLRYTLLLLWVSVLVAVLLTPIVDWISHWHVKGHHPGSGLSLLIFFSGLAIALGLLSWLAFPPILRDARGLSQQLPEHIRRWLDWAHQHLPVTTRLNESDIKRYAELLVGDIGDLFSNITNGTVKFITVILLAAYFILDGKTSFDWMMSLFPPSQQPRLRATLERGGSRMRRWLSGQGLLMLAQGAAAMLAYWLLHVRYFYVLALLAAIFNIIPVLGPVLTLVVAGLVAALDGFGKVMGVTIFYLVYHNLENAFLNPRIMKSRVHLPAVTIIISLVIGEAVAGIVGVLIAVPTAALISEIIREYLIRPHESGGELQPAAK